MKAHLILDIVTAILLILSPWIFNLINYYYYWPIAIGISILVVVVFSSPDAYRITQKDLDITKP